MAEFQAVVLAAGRGSRMYPLTEERPKALLPVGNQPLIWYPLHMLEENGFQEVIVVVRDSQVGAVSAVMDGFRSLRIKAVVEGIPEAEDWGTADSLRHLRPRIKSDVLLISCDLITTVPLRQLIDFHRVNDCTLTSLLVREKGDDGRGKKDMPTEKDLVGMSGDSRLVYFTAQADLDDELVLSRSMLKRHPHVRLYTELLDSHLYLVKKWVIDYLGDNRDLSSVKGELVPHLVQHQALTAGADYSKPLKQALQRAALSCVDSLELRSYEFSSFSGHLGGSKEFKEDLIRCHALLVRSEFTIRVNTLPSFMEANRMISQHLSAFGLDKPPNQPNWRSKGVSISPDSLVAPTAQLGEKVSVKKACVGEHCTIGERSKVINCVIMDHVHIGEGCTLQSCVVCSHVRLEGKVTLKDCYVGANFTITKEADMRGETLVVGGGLHF